MLTLLALSMSLLHLTTLSSEEHDHAWICHEHHKKVRSAPKPDACPQCSFNQGSKLDLLVEQPQCRQPQNQKQSNSEPPHEYRRPPTSHLLSMDKRLYPGANGFWINFRAVGIPTMPRALSFVTMIIQRFIFQSVSFQCARKVDPIGSGVHTILHVPRC